VVIIDYQHTNSCVRINNKLTNWFDCRTGFKQEDNVSPTLFSIFINDLVKEINDLNCGFKTGERQLSTLLYADDIVLFAKKEEDLQKNARYLTQVVYQVESFDKHKQI